jgi:hypothetical protein
MADQAEPYADDVRPCALCGGQPCLWIRRYGLAAQDLGDGGMGEPSGLSDGPQC